MTQEYECQECWWMGPHHELVCSDEDFKSGKDAGEIAWNRCPRCDSTNIEECDNE